VRRWKSGKVKETKRLKDEETKRLEVEKVGK
jgi:hypothetical protein